MSCGTFFSYEEEMQHVKDLQANNTRVIDRLQHTCRLADALCKHASQVCAALCVYDVTVGILNASRLPCVGNCFFFNDSLQKIHTKAFEISLISAASFF